MLKRALISVYDKENILELANFLASRDVEILSTGGTYKYLKKNGIKVSEVSDVTGFEEILDGRVKTLHPVIHGGILAIREDLEHMETLNRKGILPIDMVVVNLYPFFQKIEEEISYEEKLEFIDIGGPTMLRAAAKNYRDVIVISDVKDYGSVIAELRENTEVGEALRRKLAGKVFNLMSAYDAAVSSFLLEESFPEYLALSYKKDMDLRYGENPHQSAAYYSAVSGSFSMKDFTQLNGKELSYNNIKDMDAAWKLVNEFEEIACCALKHNTPCGVALGENVGEAFLKAYECDPVSIFGGIVAFNSKVDRSAAEHMAKLFLEVVIAPSFEEDALEILCAKKNLRVIKCTCKPNDHYEITSVDGGILVQQRDDKLNGILDFVTEVSPSNEEMNDLVFAMKVVKYVKSNAIVVARNGMAKGIGGGQVNRIWAAVEAMERAGLNIKNQLDASCITENTESNSRGAVLASDAFFPFSDVVEEAHKYNIKTIIQPGGSMRDNDSIEACNKYGIAMMFSGIRHFKH